MEFVDVYGTFLIVFLFTGVTVFYRNFFFQIFLSLFFSYENNNSKNSFYIGGNNVKLLSPNVLTLKIFRKNCNVVLNSFRINFL